MNSRLLTTALAALLALTACVRDDPAPRASETATPPATTPVTGSPSPTATRTPGIPAVPTPASAALTATIEKFGATKLAWRGCGGGFECAKLPVPLDYDVPNGETIEISVIRLKARNRGDRIGSVVLNPGGPGGSGVEFARQARQLLPGEILNRFDVVSFDPRGVGESAPVDCLDDGQLDRLLAADPSPDDAAEKQRLIELAREQALECKVKSGRLLPHVGTVDTAKDLDVLREALGDAGLTYIGFSYGTLLGARYAQQFPGNIRALVLDGAVDPILTPREISVAQAVGFERALKSFLDDCAAQRCAFAGHGPIGTSFDELMARIERRPLDARSDPSRKVGPSEALFGVAAALYSREYGWPVLRQALEEAYSRGDGSTLLALFDNLVERENGSYSNSVEAQAAVSCVDGVYERDPKAYDRDAAQFAKAAPRFGRALAYGPLACAFWPAPPTTRPAPARAEGAPPIVVIGTTGDPATPYEWSQSLAQQLPGVLVTYEGEGHTAYGYGRSSCVDRVVDAYLVSLTVPSPGTRCR
ncbi:MAG TPA: alpha/beta hydrolase [Frankiaceae bacterium]|nr:alpha/beta hydrolase [Frankiaceae bacterium]